MSEKIAEAMAVIKQAMIDDNPSELGSYAHSWHCNIAMCFQDELMENKSSDAHVICNDAASRFMKLCFDVETNNGEQK